MKNNKILLVLSSFFVILIVLGITTYKKTEMINPKAITIITSNIQPGKIGITETTILKDSSEPELSDKRPYIEKECHEFYNHRACIVIQNNKFYLIYDDSKSEPYDSIEHVSDDKSFIYSAMKDGKRFIILINQFSGEDDVNNDYIVLSSERTVKPATRIILSPDLKTTVRIDGTKCNQEKFADKNPGSYSFKIICDSYEIFKNNKSIGKYEWVEDLLFSSDSKKLVYIVGENCHDNIKCSKFFFVNDSGVKTEIDINTFSITGWLLNGKH